ncbi:MAG: GNAT family N-acetyltransferase [Ignavibacteria bacterium]|nr:GNAT family N-acetyltransferase [Ignavibacteria bacterium]
MKSATACFGRLSVDLQAIRKVKDKFPKDYIGVAVDAGTAVRDFAMINMKLNAIETFLFTTNLKAKLVNEAIGLKEVGRIFRSKSDGTKVETIEMRLTRNEWELQKTKK